jgi:glycosyltransferase involved in cell wall biosynthesis
MKVCFVAHDFNFFKLHISKLVAEISKDNEVVVVTDLESALPGDLGELKLKKVHFEHLKKRANKKIFDYFRYIYSLRSVVKKIKAERIFYTTLESSFFGSIISQFRSSNKSFFVITGTGPEFFKKQFRYKVLRLFYFLIFKINLLKRNCFFIFQNSQDQDLFSRLGFIDLKLSMVIGGFGVKITNIKKVYKNSKITFCFAGRIVKSKGLIELLEATSSLGKQYSNFKLIIAGPRVYGSADSISDVEFQPFLQSEFIEYAGNIGHDKMNEFYQKGDVFVLPSHREGLSKALLEAAANGMPLITSDVPGCEECIENNGYVVKVNDSNSLRKAIETFIIDPSIIKKFSNNSLEHIKKNYSLEVVAEAYTKLIN